MTVPDATVLARMRRPDITTDMDKRVSDGAAPEDRVAGVKPASERRFVIVSRRSSRTSKNRLPSAATW